MSDKSNDTLAKQQQRRRAAMATSVSVGAPLGAALSVFVGDLGDSVYGGTIMIVDAHYHLEKRVETIDALLKETDREGVERVALMGGLVDPPMLPALLRIMAPRLSQTMLSQNVSFGKSHTDSSGSA